MRTSGILLPLTALPSPYGIGTMGEAAYKFVDFLAASGQSYWQILPIGPTSFGDSPYQSFSTFAGNPYLIDLDMLQQQGLLERNDYQGLDWGEHPNDINYGLLYETRYPVLKCAYARFLTSQSAEYTLFCADNASWLDDYALFMALKDENSGKAWSKWDSALKCRQPAALAQATQKLAGQMEFWKTLQFWFFSQWTQLKTYANGHGVQMIGDLPIYVAGDSADVWANPHLFELDDDFNPISVAGCPPDGFTSDGQLWGNPIFRWDQMKLEHYAWWMRRVSHTTSIFDVTRIDHFRGFDSFYAIPGEDTTAKHGKWRKGPGIDFFREIERQLGAKQFIAEDLGFLTQSVVQLVEQSGSPGMKILEFAFDSREESNYLPHHYQKNCVVYIGTHDNDTAIGWLQTAPPSDVAFAKEYVNLTLEEGFHWGLLRAAWASVGDTVIVQMQDLLGLGSESRMNTPSTLGGNWRWRMLPNACSFGLQCKLYYKMRLYQRLPNSSFRSGAK